MLRRNLTKIVKHPLALLTTTACLFVLTIFELDRIHFSHARKFCPRMLYSNLPNNPNWECPPPSVEQKTVIDTICSQPFRYLAKGNHCFAFVSEDDQYVIKFHRFPSHMRMFPWLNRPLVYELYEKRKKIKEHNFQRMAINFLSYKNGFANLKDESGLIYVHTNKSSYLNKKVCLIDDSGAKHYIPLDRTTFILQKKAKLIYPTLKELYAKKDFPQAHSIIHQLFTLMLTSADKGYVNDDPVLYKNCGLLDGHAIHIDIGDLIEQPNILDPAVRLAYIREVTGPMRRYFAREMPELIPYYDQEMEKTERDLQR